MAGYDDRLVAYRMYECKGCYAPFDQYEQAKEHVENCPEATTDQFGTAGNTTKADGDRNE